MNETQHQQQVAQAMDEAKPPVQEIHVQSGWTFWQVGKLVMLAGGIIALFIWAVNSCRHEQTGRVRAEKHVSALQTDSTNKTILLSQKDAQIKQLATQADNAVAYGYRYKASKDSAISVAERTNSQLSINEKIVAYFRGLVNNKTLPALVPATPASLISEPVITAGLNTVGRELIERKRGDSLAQSIAVRDARLAGLSEDNRSLKESNYKLHTGYRTIGDSAKAMLKKSIPILQIPRRKALKKIIKQAEEYDLVEELNKP